MTLNDDYQYQQSTVISPKNGCKYKLPAQPIRPIPANLNSGMPIDRKAFPKKSIQNILTRTTPTAADEINLLEGYLQPAGSVRRSG